MNQKKNGAIVVIALLSLGILLVLGTYFLSFNITESKIVKSQETGSSAYYIAEAGINEVIWKLKNDDTVLDGDFPWKTCFASATAECPDCNTFSATFSTGTDYLMPGGSVVISINNFGCGNGEIIATSTVEMAGGKKSQRVVKVGVFKAVNTVLDTEDSPFFTGGSGDINITNANLKIQGGNLFCSNALLFKDSSRAELYDDPDTETLEGKVFARDDVVGQEQISVCQAICAKDICNPSAECGGQCPPGSIAMPSVDFDSASVWSLKSRAQALGSLYTSSQFDDLLWSVGSGGTLTLDNKVTYVTGPINLKGNRRLIVNGILAAEGTVSIGESLCWTKESQTDCGNSQITINESLTGPEEEMAGGLFAKGKLDFGPYSSFTDISVVGAIYALDEIKLASVPNLFNLTGGILGRKISFTGLLQWFNINYDYYKMWKAISLSSPPGGVLPVEFSPTVTVEHWEGTY